MTTRVIEFPTGATMILDMYPLGLCWVRPIEDKWLEELRVFIFPSAKAEYPFLKRHLFSHLWLVDKIVLNLSIDDSRCFEYSASRGFGDGITFKIWKSIEAYKKSKEPKPPEPEIRLTIQVNGKPKETKSFPVSWTPEDVSRWIESRCFVPRELFQSVTVIPNPVANVITKPTELLSETESLFGDIDLHETGLSCDVCGKELPVSVFHIYEDAALEHRLQICKGCLNKVASKMP